MGCGKPSDTKEPEGKKPPAEKVEAAQAQGPKPEKKEEVKAVVEQSKEKKEESKVEVKKEEKNIVETNVIEGKKEEVKAEEVKKEEVKELPKEEEEEVKKVEEVAKKEEDEAIVEHAGKERKEVPEDKDEVQPAQADANAAIIVPTGEEHKEEPKVEEVKEDPAKQLQELGYKLMPMPDDDEAEPAHIVHNLDMMGSAPPVKEEPKAMEKKEEAPAGENVIVSNQPHIMPNPPAVVSEAPKDENFEKKPDDNNVAPVNVDDNERKVEVSAPAPEGEKLVIDDKQAGVEGAGQQVPPS